MLRSLAKLRRVRTAEHPPAIKRWTVVRGDLVEVNNGREKGNRGKVLEVLRSRNSVIVEGLNMHIRHLPKEEGRMGSKVQVESPIHYSDVQLIDPTTK